MKPYVAVDHVDVIFETKNGAFQALSNVNIAIAKGEFISIIGHSGCGKSTVLNLIAGLLDASTGGVLLEDREIKGLP